MGFRRQITSEADLRRLVPAPPAGRLSGHKQLDHLDSHARAWIATSPLVLLATSDGAGRCDVSPRGGPPGWVQVLDDHRLALADAPGNRRLDSLVNIVEQPHCGLLFLVPGRSDVLRVNGRACLTSDPDLLGGIPGEPVVAIGVVAEEVFTHCAKALIRSGVWKADTWPPVDALPSLAEMLRDHAAINGRTVDVNVAEQQVAQSIAERMW